MTTKNESGLVPPPGGVKLTLKDPVSLGDDIHRELTFREPKGRDMADLEFGTTGNRVRLGILLEMAKATCEQAGANRIIDDLSVRDTLELAGLMGGFFGDGGPTGVGA
jgi:hypothetical protein